jgi:hypothetical protein
VNPRSDSGVVLIQVVLAMTAFAGCCALVIDYGILWVARSQAQAAADAASLAGATALAFDSVYDTTIPANAATGVASQNDIWGEAPSATTVTVEPLYTCQVPGMPAPIPRIASCVTADVFRNSDKGNPLPTMFGKLLNVTNQNIRAKATAAVVPGNTTDCLWPLAIPDKWEEHYPSNGPWLSSPPASTFTKYTGTGTPVATPDSYTPPNITVPGSGFSISFGYPSQIGTNIPLTLTPASFSTDISAGQFVAVSVPRLDGGGFSDSMATCGKAPVSIGDTLPVDSSATLSAATAGAGARFTADSGASWNTTTWKVVGSCAADPVPCAAISPRRVVMAVFNVDTYEETRRTGTPTIQITNFVGFFITRVTSTEIDGNLALYPGTVNKDKPMVGYVSGFLRTPVMYR